MDILMVTKNKIYLIIIFKIIIILNIISSPIDISKYSGHGIIRSSATHASLFILKMIPMVATAHAVERIMNPLWFDRWKDNRLNKSIEENVNFEKVKNFAEELIDEKVITTLVDNFVNDQFIEEYIYREFKAISIGSEIKRRVKKIKKEEKKNNNGSIINTKNALIATGAIGAGVVLMAAEKAYQKAKKTNKNLSRMQYLKNSISSLFTPVSKKLQNVKNNIKEFDNSKLKTKNALIN